jgi:HlyD family type I secretion membrane fusion protein
VEGEVINLRFTSAGAVIAPREHVADIVPANPRLVVEARIRPEDISRVHQEQPARIRFTAFAYRSTGLVDGKVIYVSADRITDPASREPYYIAQIEAAADSLDRNRDIRPQAGMPAEVYLEGEQRTVLQYLVEPVLQVVRRAGRER